MVIRIAQLLILSAIVVSTASGQVQLGLQTGASFVNLVAHSDYSLNFQYKPVFGFSIGGICNVPLLEWLSLQAEPRYIQKRSKTEPDIRGGGFDETTDYLELPILIKGEFSKSVIRPFFLFGPRVSMLLSSLMKVSDPPSPSYQLDTKWIYHRFDFGLDFGGGAEYYITPGFSVSPSVRYSFGVLNISASYYTLYARGFQFYLDLLVRLADD